MVVQRPRGLFNGMLMNRAVGMDMRDDVDFCVPVQRGMVVAVRARPGLCDERGLERKRHRSRDHHDVGNLPQKRPFTGAETHTFPVFSATRALH
jgi:hypothetical protein